MIYKKMMDDKLTLSDAFRQWLKKKQNILSLQKETNELDKQKRRYATISKAKRLELIEEIKRNKLKNHKRKIKKNFFKNLNDNFPKSILIKYFNTQKKTFKLQWKLELPKMKVKTIDSQIFHKK